MSAQDQPKPVALRSGLVQALLLGGALLGGSVAAARADCPDALGGAPGITLTAAQLASGDRDFAARFAAGPLDSGACPQTIRVGYFNRAPSVNLTLTGTTATGVLRVNLRTTDDSCDPVVLLATPDGQWFNDDDSGRNTGHHWNTLIEVPASRDGVYRIWLGHYHGDRTCDGTLRIGYTLGAGGHDTRPGPSAGASSAGWFPITQDQRQNATQPGGVTTVPANPGPGFASGSYDIYTADAGPVGLGPYTNIRRFSVTLESNRSYAVDLGAATGLGIEAGGTRLMAYGDPGPGRSSIYARNSNPSTWRAICVLPAGAAFEGCGGGGMTVYSEWSTITNDQRQFAAQPGGVDPLRTCDRTTQRYAGDFPAGRYDVYVGGAGPNGLGPITDIRRFEVQLDGGRLYAIDLGGSNGFGVSVDGPQLLPYGRPNPGEARIYTRNSSIMSWRAICVLPSGWPRAWCELGNPWPCSGP
jgi:hypothetical protein